MIAAPRCCTVLMNSVFNLTFLWKFISTDFDDVLSCI